MIPVAEGTLSLLAVVVGALSFVPLALFRDPERIPFAQKWIQRQLIIPCRGLTQVGFSMFFLKKAGERSYRNHGIVSLSAVILNVAIAVACVLAMDLGPAPSPASMETYLVVLDCYFLLWNLLALAVLFKLAPLILRKRREALKPGFAAESPSTDSTMDGDWRRIEGAIVGSGLFRKSALDLAMLSRETGIPKNRISLVVNTVSGNILGAAFDAGFNSKATLYNWVKKDLDGSPSEYLRRLRSDTLPLGIDGGA